MNKEEFELRKKIIYEKNSRERRKLYDEYKPKESGYLDHEPPKEKIMALRLKLMNELNKLQEEYENG